MMGQTISQVITVNSSLVMHDKKVSVIMRLDNTDVNDGHRGMGGTIHTARPPHPLRVLDHQTPAPKIAAPACPSKPRLSRPPQNLNMQITPFGLAYHGAETLGEVYYLPIVGFCV
jgi:hypothetical protein